MIVASTATALASIEPVTTPLRLITVETDGQRAVLAEMVEQTGSEVGLDPYQTGPPTYWLIEVEGGYAGYTGIHSVNWKDRRCRGIIWVAPEYRRRGIATEAVRVRNDLLFDQWNLNRIEWAVSASNGASAVFSRVRSYARLEGTAKEAVYYDGKYHDVALYALTKRQRDLMLDKRNDFTNPGQGEPD